MQIVTNKMLLLSSLLALGGILLLIKNTLHGYSEQITDSPDNSIHGRLRDSKRSLEKTALVIQGVLDEMDPETPEHPDGSNN